MKPSLKPETKTRTIADIHYAIFVAKLTNKELYLLRLWMEGYNHKEIAFLADLPISQPAISKRITAIQERVKRAYLRLKELRNPDTKT